jgi:hypothetical protein
LLKPSSRWTIREVLQGSLWGNRTNSLRRGRLVNPQGWMSTRQAESVGIGLPVPTIPECRADRNTVPTCIKCGRFTVVFPAQHIPLGLKVSRVFLVRQDHQTDGGFWGWPAAGTVKPLKFSIRMTDRWISSGVSGVGFPRDGTRFTGCPQAGGPCRNCWLCRCNEV